MIVNFYIPVSTDVSCLSTFTAEPEETEGGETSTVMASASSVSFLTCFLRQAGHVRLKSWPVAVTSSVLPVASSLSRPTQASVFLLLFSKANFFAASRRFYPRKNFRRFAAIFSNRNTHNIRVFFFNGQKSSIFGTWDWCFQTIRTLWLFGAR